MPALHGAKNDSENQNRADQAANHKLASNFCLVPSGVPVRSINRALIGGNADAEDKRLITQKINNLFDCRGQLSQNDVWSYRPEPLPAPLSESGMQVNPTRLLDLHWYRQFLPERSAPLRGGLHFGLQDRADLT